MTTLFNPNTFSWVGTHILQLTVLLVLVGVLTRTVIRHRPHLSYLLWLVVLLKCWTPPLWTSPTGVFSWMTVPRFPREMFLEQDPRLGTDRAPLSHRSLGGPADVSSRDVKPNNASKTRHGHLGHVSTSTASAGPFSTAAILLYVWCAGVAVVLACAAYRWKRLRHIRLTALTQDGGERIARLYDEVVRTMPRPPAVKLQLVSAPLGPGLVGVARPAIVLPTHLAAALSNDELRCVLAHELRHASRRDHWWVPLQIATNAIWWFHPGVWWLTRELNFERERVCDEETIVRHRMTARDYVAVLLSVLEQKLAVGSSRRMGINFAARQAKARVHHLIDRSDMLQGRTHTWQWAIAVVALFVALPGAALRGQGATLPKSRSGDRTTLTSKSFTPDKATPPENRDNAGNNALAPADEGQEAAPISRPLGILPHDQLSHADAVVPVSIHGVVRDQQQQPIANAKVMTVDLRSDAANVFPRFETTTDGVGRFRAAATLSLEEGHGQFYIHVLTPTKRPIVSPRTYYVTRLANGKIHATYQGLLDNSFTVELLIPDNDQSRNDAITTPATIGPIEIVEVGTRVVRGRFRLQGKPLSNAEIRVIGFANDLPSDSPLHSLLAELVGAALIQRTNEAGEWSFPALPVAPLTLAMTHESLPQMKLTWTAEESDAISVDDFELPQITEAHFPIVDAEDTSPVEANVRLIQTSDQWEATFQGEGKGKESVTMSVFPGQYAAHIRPIVAPAEVRRVYLPRFDVSLEVSADSANRFRIDLAPACLVEVHVVDDVTNAPVPKIRLVAERLDAADANGVLETGWNAAAQTDARGVVQQYVAAPQVIQVQLSEEAELQGYDSIAARSEAITVQPRVPITRTMRLKRITTPRLMRQDLRHLARDQRDMIERYHERGIFVQPNRERGPTVHVSHAWKGDVDDLKKIAAMGQLQSIVFNSVSLAGPNGIEHPIRGRDRVLVTDAAIEALGNLQVNQVYFDTNALTDAGMKQIARWQGVEDIVMAAPQQATSAGFAQLGKLGELKSLQISGTHPGLNTDAIRAWHGLMRLEFVRMYYAGGGLENLPATVHHLSLNDTSDASLQDLDRLPHLAGLAAFGQGVTDAGMAAVARIKSLRSLAIANASITDQGIRQLAGMEKLQSLTLRGVKVTRGCVPHLLAMPALEDVSVDDGLSDEDLEPLRKKGVKIQRLGN